MVRALLVTGDRHANPALWRETVRMAIASFNPAILIHGGARGIDTIAGDVATAMGNISVEAFPADWDAYGRAAGPKRNQQMLDQLLALREDGHTVAVLAFHDDLDSSKGTKQMVSIAKRAGIAVTHCTSDRVCKEVYP